MFQDKEFLTVSEAVMFTEKSEKTIRFLIKELLEVEKTSGSASGSLLTEVRGGNERKFYKISKEFLLNKFKDTSRSTSGSSEETSGNTSRSTSGSVSNNEVEILHDWLDDKSETIDLLRKELLEKNNQIIKFQELLENQQKMSMHGQLQIEKIQLQLESSEQRRKEEQEKIKPSRKKVWGLF